MVTLDLESLHLSSNIIPLHKSLDIKLDSELRSKNYTCEKV